MPSASEHAACRQEVIDIGERHVEVERDLLPVRDPGLYEVRQMFRDERIQPFLHIRLRLISPRHGN